MIIPQSLPGVTVTVLSPTPRGSPVDSIGSVGSINTAHTAQIFPQKIMLLLILQIPQYLRELLVCLRRGRPLLLLPKFFGIGENLVKIL